MKSVSKLLLFCVIFVFSGLMAVHAQAKQLIAVSTPDADHGWTGGIVWWVEKAVHEFSEQYPDFEFVYKFSSSEKEQAADVEKLLEQNPSALVILPHRPAPLTTVLNKVNQIGAYIVVVDRSIPKVPKDIYLAGDNYGFGFESGKYLAGAMQAKGNVLVMEGIPCEGNTLRVNGFKDAIKDLPGLVVMDSQPAYWNPSIGYELMQQYLDEYPQIDAIWVGDDDVMEGALKAYHESGRSDVKLFLGGGGSKNILKMILDKDPLVKATVTYPPKMIYDGIEMAIKHLKDGEEFEPEITIASELVTIDNAADYYFPDNIY